MSKRLLSTAAGLVLALSLAGLAAAQDSKTTTTVTTQRIFTLMHDSQYRVAIAWQNTAYNQPPHPSFFLGDGMSMPPQPNIYVVP